jgi:hypothetical protein
VLELLGFLAVIGLAVVGARIAAGRRRKAGKAPIRPEEHAVGGAVAFFIGLIVFAVSGTLVVVISPGDDDLYNAGTILAVAFGAWCFVMVYAFVLNFVADWMRERDELRRAKDHAQAKREARLIAAYRRDLGEE